MIGKWQFSLGYLLWLTFWWATALGLTSTYVNWTDSSEFGQSVSVLLSVLLVVCYGTAIGGLFGQLRRGAVIGVGVVILVFAVVVAFSFVR
jgi:hypothetical protein